MQFILRNPRYRYLFGPVSISDNYTPISKDLIVRFMQREKQHPLLSRLVTARNPYRSSEGSISQTLEAEQISESLCDIKEVSARIASVEPDGKGIPILLRQYLKLNATVLSFNVDPDFSKVLDALILVDLCEMPDLILKRYLGKEGYVTFRKQHSENASRRN